MSSQRAIQPTHKQTPDSSIFVEAEKLFEQMREFSAKATATLKDGILELVLAKAVASKAVDVEVKAPSFLPFLMTHRRIASAEMFKRG
ncbi:MAG: hypothetical protein L0220_03805 [Acidobacteria bacterium]|nr:hypothetical protein [Acidobacteriota bacterium]